MLFSKVRLIILCFLNLEKYLTLDIRVNKDIVLYKGLSAHQTFKNKNQTEKK